MLLRNLKDRYLTTREMVFDYYPKNGKEIYVDPLFGCWKLDMIRSYPLDDMIELYSNNVLIDSYTWDDELDIKVINTKDYQTLTEVDDEIVDKLIKQCDHNDIFYIPKTRYNAPRFKV